MLANGITTAFHGVTLSWEPGLRSPTAWQALLTALDADSWTCDMRVHLRWEAYNLDALDIALADIEAGRVHLLAFNDHTPSILKKLKDPVEGAKYAGRAGHEDGRVPGLHRPHRRARRMRCRRRQSRIAAAARAAGLPMASHDDDTHRGARLISARWARVSASSRWPRRSAGTRAQHGDFVVMGSPNVVRGGSHLDWASAAVMAEAGICDVLSSDYYYPAMARAAFVLADRGVFDLARAWALISANPARAAGLTDRGTIAPGKRADLVLVDPQSRRVLATLVGGRIAHLAAGGRLRG